MITPVTAEAATVAGDPMYTLAFGLPMRPWKLRLALLIVTSLAAAAYPIWLTTRLPIAATLRREVVG